MTRFLAVGHVSRDEMPDGGHRLGGTALYAAATAARLGVPASLVTRVGPSERAELDALCAGLDIDLRSLSSVVTTTFVFSWTGVGRRVLRLRARAKAIGATDVPSDLIGADVVLLGSIAQELSPDLLAVRGARATVLAAQGLLRGWDADGTARMVSWAPGARSLAGLSCVVVSEDDIGGDAGIAEDWSRSAPVVVTLADRGARLFEAGRAVADVRAFTPRGVVDPTGAGDAFAAGLAVALSEGKPLRAACVFASAVASFAVEDVGTAGLADREAVERRVAG